MWRKCFLLGVVTQDLHDKSDDRVTAGGEPVMPSEACEWSFLPARHVYTSDVSIQLLRRLQILWGTLEMRQRRF